MILAVILCDCLQQKQNKVLLKTKLAVQKQTTN